MDDLTGSAATAVHQASLRAALETLAELQRLEDEADDLDPLLAARYRAYLGAVAEHYLVFLGALAKFATMRAEPQPRPGANRH